MPHVLVAGRIHPAGIALIEAAAGVTFDYVEAVSVESFAPRLADADGLVLRTQPLTAALLEGAGRLRVVSRHGVGYDSVDVAALTARGIPLTIVGDVNSRSVAEHALAMLLAGAKRLPQMDAALRDGGWAERDRYAGREVHGRRLLIIGYGRAGRLLGQMARGLGMEVSAHDPFVQDGAGVEMEPDLGTALERADYVSVHAPKGERALLGAAEIARMKPGAVLVNTARGGMVNEAALIAALDESRIAVAGLDVFEAEPPNPDDPLLRHPRVILSPHVAGLSAESMERMAEVSVRNVLDFFDGRLDPEMVVNRAVLE